MTITGKELRVLRRLMDLSQSEVAERLHRSQTYVSEIELGLRVPKPNEGKILQRLFGIPLNTRAKSI